MFKTAIVAFSTALLGLSVVLPADAAPRDHRKVIKHPPVKVLPKSHYRIVHKRKPYFYSKGRFYRHNDGVYLRIVAPIGAIVPVLPRGYVTFGIGPDRFFYYGGIYYNRVATGYVVVKEPANAEKELARGSDRIIIYPAAGQSDQQKAKDKFECHEWAADETHYDPSDEESDPLLRADYKRAMTACLEARQYVVK